MPGANEERLDQSLSRSFGHPITKLEELEHTVSTYTAPAAAKMRSQHQACAEVQCLSDRIRSKRRRDMGRHGRFAPHRPILKRFAGAETNVVLDQQCESS